MDLNNLTENEKSLICRVLDTPDGKKCLRVVLQGALNYYTPGQEKFERVRELLRIISDEIHEIEATGAKIPDSLERLWSEITLYLEVSYAKAEDDS